LAVASDDGTVLLWNVAHRDRPGVLGFPLDEQKGRVMSVAFAPDGVTLATTNLAADNRSYDRAVFWDLTELLDLATQPVGRACRITARGLNPDEWARYVPALPYRQLCGD
jgi:WD40 repeat protein